MDRRDVRSKLAEFKAEKKLKSLPKALFLWMRDFSSIVEYLNDPALARNKEQFMFLPCVPQNGIYYLRDNYVWRMPAKIFSFGDKEACLSARRNRNHTIDQKFQQDNWNSLCDTMWGIIWWNVGSKLMNICQKESPKGRTACVELRQSLCDTFQQHVQLSTASKPSRFCWKALIIWIAAINHGLPTWSCH